MYFIGVDLGGTKIASALVNEKGDVIAENVTETEASKGTEHVINKIKSEIKKLYNAAGSVPVEGIGLGIPGLMDIEKGISVFAGNLGWRNVPVIDEFKKDFNLPIFMDNDVRVATLAEKYFGAGRDINTLICVTLGTGVGSGIILDGKIYRGHSFSAGEIGHTTVIKDGLYCNCGNRGCLEMYASAPGIVRQIKKHIMEGHYTIMTKMADGDIDKITTKTLSAAFDEGDSLAHLVMENTAELLGIGLSTYAQIINPEMIIIGGGVSLLGDKLFIPLRKYFNEHLMQALRDKIPIVPAKLKDKAGAVGAAALAMVNIGII